MNKLTARRVLIKVFNRENKDLLALYGVYKRYIDPTLTYETFLQLYCNGELIAIDLTLFYDENGIAGFNAAFFYSAVVQGKASYIALAATGLREDLQNQGLHKKVDLYFKFIRFALAHPRKPLMVAAYVVNPKDPYILWFHKENPLFMDKHALLVVINVSLPNICGTAVNFILHFAHKKLAAAYKGFVRSTSPIRHLSHKMQIPFFKCIRSIRNFMVLFYRETLLLFPKGIKVFAFAVKRKTINLALSILKKWIL